MENVLHQKSVEISLDFAVHRSTVVLPFQVLVCVLFLSYAVAQLQTGVNIDHAYIISNGSKFLCHYFILAYISACTVDD